MKNDKRMSIMLVVRTEKTDYMFFCNEFDSQEELFAKCVADCIKHGVSYKTDVVLFGKNNKVIDRFGYEE